MNAIEELLKDYPVVITVPVAWGEMDAMQHVNNVIYLRWFESARIAYFEQAGVREGGKVAGIGPILHTVSCRYRIPLTYPDTVSIGTRVTNMEADRFFVIGRIVSHQHQKVAAESESIIVAFDYRQQQKAIWPEGMKQGILNLEKMVSP